MILLDETEIRSYLQDFPIDLEIMILKSTPSTNDYFKNHTKKPFLQFCFTEHQTQGRGRFGRSWIAPFGVNIMFSCRFVIEQNSNHLAGLSLCTGLAVLTALEEFGIEGISCKWPNDILYHQQKLAGILIEIQAQRQDQTEVIIGIGLNVNMDKAMLREINRPVTSLQVITGIPQNRNKIAALLIQNLCTYLERFRHKGFTDFQEEWNKRDALTGKTIALKSGNDLITGIAAGVDAFGNLLLQFESGEIKAYCAGEVTLSAYSLHDTHLAKNF